MLGGCVQVAKNLPKHTPASESWRGFLFAKGTLMSKIADILEDIKRYDKIERGAGRKLQESFEKLKAICKHRVLTASNFDRCAFYQQNP